MTIRLDYDPRFVEQATFLAARGAPERECALHEKTDPLYRIDDAELRQRAFREAYAELFRQFGLERPVTTVIMEFPLIRERLPRGVIHEADRRRSQAVDLVTENGFASSGGRVLMIALCPEVLLDRDVLEPWLRRELLHVEDMLDEAFGYSDDVPGDSPCERNLVRERYGVLWNIYVEGRLRRMGKISSDDENRLWGLFARAFARHGQPPDYHAFARILNSDRLTHSQLMRWARQNYIESEIKEGTGDERCFEISGVAV